MTDTFQVQGDFAPAESFTADFSVQDDAVLTAAVVEQATAEITEETTEQPNGFIELGLAPELVQAVADLGYTQPTTVQLQAIPLAMGAGAESGRF
ncbi:MAG: ATP-dependent helicase, partial [Giesbergeria sp.]|nr:ATP-dependent helicase [Giesbergeria sp.]